MIVLLWFIQYGHTIRDTATAIHPNSCQQAHQLGSRLRFSSEENPCSMLDECYSWVLVRYSYVHGITRNHRHVSDSICECETSYSKGIWGKYNLDCYVLSKRQTICAQTQ